MTESKSFL